MGLSDTLRIMNETAQSRLYMLTALACTIWLCQNIYTSINDGTIMHWASWVFILCIGIVVVYSGYQGWSLYKKTHADSDDTDDDNDVDSEK